MREQEATNAWVQVAQIQRPRSELGLMAWWHLCLLRHNNCHNRSFLERTAVLGPGA